MSNNTVDKYIYINLFIYGPCENIISLYVQKTRNNR